jgi:hypothetical protein
VNYAFVWSAVGDTLWGATVVKESKRPSAGEPMRERSSVLKGVALYVPAAVSTWGLAACLIAPGQVTVLGPSVMCGASLGVLISLLLSPGPG